VELLDTTRLQGVLDATRGKLTVMREVFDRLPRTGETAQAHALFDEVWGTLEVAQRHVDGGIAQDGPETPAAVERSRSRFSTALGTCRSNRFPARVIYGRSAHEGRASW
jgi:hypothetical protein